MSLRYAHLAADQRREAVAVRGADGCWLMTAVAPLLDGRTSHGAIRAKNATITRLRLKQCLTVRALVEILARVRWHDLFTLLSAIRAGEHGLHN